MHGRIGVLPVEMAGSQLDSTAGGRNSRVVGRECWTLITVSGWTFTSTPETQGRGNTALWASLAGEAGLCRGAQNGSHGLPSGPHQPCPVPSIHRYQGTQRYLVPKRTGKSQVGSVVPCDL